MQEIYDIPLHDIKSNVDIEEYSLYYLIGLNVLLVLLIMAALYLLVRWIKHKKQVTLRKQHAKELKNLDLTHTKDAAYALSFYGATFKEDTPRHKKSYEELFDALESYKYKREVAAFSEETLHFIELYRGMIDE